MKSIKLIDTRGRTELSVNKIIDFCNRPLESLRVCLPNVFGAGISSRIIFEHKLP